jgi:hypothetical protein
MWGYYLVGLSCSPTSVDYMHTTYNMGCIERFTMKRQQIPDFSICAKKKTKIGSPLI